MGRRRIARAAGAVGGARRVDARAVKRCWQVIKCEQILTVSKDRLSLDAVGRLDPAQMRDVDAALRLSLALAVPETL